MNVLFVAAHPDDIEFGCLGAVLRHQSLGDTVYYLIASDCLDIPGNETVVTESEATVSVLGPARVVRLGLANRFLDSGSARARLREALEAFRDRDKVDIVYTHWENDLHQDHKSVADETVRVFRYRTIIEYENQHSCPHFIPNHYLVLPASVMRFKQSVLSMFKSQVKRGVVTKATALATFRGSEIETQFAEGYILWRYILTCPSD